MSELPRAVLSDHFQELMLGKRLISAVFLTFRFDPAFFEQEVLPIFLDIPLSHASAIRLVQMEGVLNRIGAQMAVYYAENGLMIGETSAKLPIQRVPVRHPTGYFHPKNVFLLTESAEPDADGNREQTLLVACMSANLTEAGWWRNVEVCHVEEIEIGTKTRLRDDVLGFLAGLKRRTASETAHPALQSISDFLRQTEQRAQKSSGQQLHTHFYDGKTSVPDFLEEVAGQYIRDAYLEVISPYLDDADTCRPLEELIHRFRPREVRVFLPRAPNGDATCRKELYQSVRALPNVSWGSLPRDLLRLGRTEDAGDRMVHAKVYRFFRQKPKWELFFIGSPNLTTAAHQKGGNLETGFIVDKLAPPGACEFWLSAQTKVPLDFKPNDEAEGTTKETVTHLVLRYRWDTGEASAFWNEPENRPASPCLELDAQGQQLGKIGPLPSSQWTSLDAGFSEMLQTVLRRTSFISVREDGKDPVTVLVQEEGMTHKPSLLADLSVQDILRYWSLLTSEQRSAFLELRATELIKTGQGLDLVTTQRLQAEQDTLFDRFAGFFHAFGCLERAVKKAIEENRELEAVYLLFGKKYDSLGSLLTRVAGTESKQDDVERYVLALCAKQVCQQVRKDYAEFWQNHPADAKEIERLCGETAARMQEALATKTQEDMKPFLDWFEGWFLKKALPAEGAND